MKKIISLCSVLLTLLLISCNNKSGKHNTSKLTVGIQNSPSNSLVIIAAEKKLFDADKVTVEIKNFSAGKLALQAMLGNANDVDIAISAETPVVLSTLGGNNFTVLTQIVDAKNECRVVVRKNKSLDTPEKYFSIKRKLATSIGGSPEWLTYNFINRYKLNKDNIEIVAMKPEDMPAAIISNSVSAISIFDPYARLAEKNLGDNALTFLNTDISSYYVASTKTSVFKEKQEAIREFIRGLRKAEDFIKSNPAEAKRIIAEHTKLDLGIINDTWANYSFKVRFSNDLINSMEAETDWAIGTNKYPKDTPRPNFKTIIASSFLNDILSSHD